MIKKIIFSLIAFFIIIESFAFSQDQIIPGGESAVQTGDVDRVFIFTKDSIFGLLLLIFLGVFIFIGIRLIVARGNQEDFKKSLLQLVYAVVGLFVISIAYLAVKLVAGLSLN